MIFESPHPPVPLRDITVTERLFEGLLHRPDEVAMVDGPTGRRITAGELVDAIRRFAGGLVAHGFGPGTTVGLMAPNIPEYAVVFHGVAWGGGTVTTINPTYTAPEVRHQLTDSGATLLVTVPAFLDTARSAVEGTEVREIVVIGEAPGATPLSAFLGDPLAAQHPVDLDEHIVVLPYSSGTTGLPKGVMLTHRNLVVNIDQAGAAVDIRPGEWTVAFLPFFHIYGQTVLMNVYLARGANVVTMPRFDLETFLRLCAEYRTPRVWAVPPVAIALAKHPLVDDYDLSAVRSVYSAAAPADASLTDAVGQRLGAVCIQAYGMTELSPISHCTPENAPRPGAVGVGVANTLSRIVDPETGQDAAPGEEGELWVRGPQVMKGYLNNPEATAKTITPDGWLRTGDLAMIDADGYVHIRDRVKELIKYKGFQVAPAEVEAALLTHPGIADAAVIGRPDDEAGEVPVAFVVRAPGSDVTGDEVTAHLTGCLAHYKRPEAIHFVESVPKSASGKILRRVLRDSLERG
jgi:4-coumarate--CoA ligase